MKIQLFAIGGTFDKEYNLLNGELIFKDTHVSRMLQMGRTLLDIDVKTLMMIDSLDMTQQDRKIIADNCKRINVEKILITHGTDTMVDTARIITKTVKDKTIVLTGAMVPYAFGSSDGLFNLGCALGFVQSLPCGVYIVMNGRALKWNEVKKDTKSGIFKKTG